jgi:hypothetical protein
MSRILDAGEIANSSIDVGTGFSIDPVSLVVSLRRLANAFEAGEAVATKATVYSCSQVNEYPRQALVVQWCESLVPGRKL